MLVAEDGKAEGLAQATAQGRLPALDGQHGARREASTSKGPCR